MVIDAWFPKNKRSPGVFGGGQVHVRELRRVLEKKYRVKISLYYPAHPNIIYRLLWTYIAAARIIQHGRKHRFDLIHSHGYNAGLAAKIAADALKIPVLHTVHGSSLLDMKKKGPKAWMEQWLLTKIKYNAQISVASNFLKHPNVNKTIHVIPNGVNVDEFDKIEVEKNSEPTIIWVGRNDPVKGVANLKEAIRRLRKTFPNLQAKLITGGQITGLSLIKAYKRSHVFTLPSLAEGQPITLLEAWAAKLPVVVTSVGDNVKMVKNGINGYLVEPGNIRALTDTLAKVMRARIKNQKMGNAGHELVKREYTWDRVAEKTFAVYTELLQSK